MSNVSEEANQFLGKLSTYLGSATHNTRSYIFVQLGIGLPPEISHLSTNAKFLDKKKKGKLQVQHIPQSQITRYIPLFSVSQNQSFETYNQMKPLRFINMATLKSKWWQNQVKTTEY